MNKEYLPTIAEYIYRYSPARPKIAMDRLMKVEVIRNNLSKTTVYNMLIGVKRYLREGKINRGISKELINEIQKLKETRGIPQDITEEQPKELTIDEQIQHLNNQFEVATQQLDAVIDCIDNKIEELQEQKEKTEHLKRILGIEYDQLYNQLFSAKAKQMLI
jgi:SMC interacting uncharacterized protein involved in chromosome segregation